MVGRFTGFALALALLLAGCTDQARPDDTPTLKSPTPSPSTSPTSSADLAALARQTVLDYYAEATRAGQTGNTTALARLSTVECSCRRLLDYFQSKWRAGSIRGFAFEVSRAEVLDASASSALVRAEYGAPAYEVLDQDGRVVEKVPAQRTAAVVRLIRNGPTYLLSHVGLT